MIRVRQPSPLWAVLPLGKWSWVVQERWLSRKRGSKPESSVTQVPDYGFHFQGMMLTPLSATVLHGTSVHSCTTLAKAFHFRPSVIPSKDMKVYRILWYGLSKLEASEVKCHSFKWVYIYCFTEMQTGEESSGIFKSWKSMTFHILK